MANLESTQLKDGFQTLVSIGTTTVGNHPSNPATGSLTNGKGTALTQVTLGLGSASAPSYSFTGDVDTGMFSSGANVLNLATGGNNRMTIASGGNISIGTANSSAKLQVGTSSEEILRLERDTTTNNSFIDLTYASGHNNDSDANHEYSKIRTKVVANLQHQEAGELHFQTIGGGTGSSSPSALSTALVIDSSGKVGIGSAPTSLLQLEQSIVPRITLIKTGVLSWYLGNVLQGSDNNFTIGTDSGGNTNILTLDTSGRVGIGISPSHSLDINSGGSTTTARVSGVTNSASQAILRMTGYSVSGTEADIGAINFTNAADSGDAIVSSITAQKEGTLATGAGELQFKTKPYNGSLATRLTIQGDGNVGIGTSSIDGTLHLDAGTSSDLVIEKDDAGYASVRFHNGGSQVSYIQLDNSEDMVHYGGSGVNQIIYAGGSERMRIDASGNVGINTTGPTSLGGGAKLTVNQAADGNIVFARGGSTRQVQLGTTSTTGYINADNTSGGLTFNVNASARMRIDSAGNVGIGGTPASISGTARWLTLNADSGSSASGGIIHQVDGTTKGAQYVFGSNVYHDAKSGIGHQFAVNNGSNAMTINTSGNVGIGTTNPSTPLNVAGSSGGGSIKISGDMSAGAYYYGYMFDGSSLQGTTQTNIFYAGGAVKADTTITDFASLRIDAPSTAASNAVITNNYGIYQASTAQKNVFNGNVGIGTTPSSKLDVAGDVTLDNILLTTATLPAQNTPSINLRDTNNEIYFQAGSANVFNFMKSDYSTMLSLDGTNSATFAGTIDVNTASNGVPTIKLSHTNTGADNFEIKAGTTGVSNGGFSIRDVDASANRFVIDSNGNVGINTSSPDYKLQINGSGTVARFTDGTSHMDFYSGSGLNEIATVSPLLLSVGGTERMRIDASGNVGIGVTDITKDLEVSSSSNPTISIANKDTSLVADQTLGTLDFASNNEGSLSNAYRSFASISAITESTVTGTASVDGALIFSTSLNNTQSEKVRILSSGGITFNGDTATANALDDYEEGTHTTSLSDGTHTASLGDNELAYTKIGNMVTITGQFFVASYNSSASSSRVSLPFTIANLTDSAGNFAGTVRAKQLNTSNTHNVVAFGDEGNGYVLLQETVDNGSPVNIGGGAYSSGTEITLNFSYFTS